MVPPATLLDRPFCKPTSAEIDEDLAGPSLLTQSLEDLRLAERVECALRATGYGSLRRIEVTVQAPLVILKGRVPTYYLKQAAQTTALAVPGVFQIRNDLEVM